MNTKYNSEKKKVFKNTKLRRNTMNMESVKNLTKCRYILRDFFYVLVCLLACSR